MSTLLIKSGRVIDPANGLDAVRDILIEDGRIVKVAGQLQTAAGSVIDASGTIVIPGLVDMHVHLRQPGREDKETVASGTAAALKGGVTRLLAMPNTEPAIDAPEAVRLLNQIIAQSATAKVSVCGALTVARAGRQLTDFSGLKAQGAIALSDDGASVDNQDLMQQALEEARRNNLPVICHCEDVVLSHQGVVNLGLVSTRLGLRGVSAESEYRRVERDIALAQKAGATVHIAHVSCRRSVELIAAAKKQGVKVTAETAPHYFTLTEEAVLDYDANMKMNPPLRSHDDRQAIRQGLADGTIDAIASDHAPHTENEKEIEFERAEFGVVGLETELSVAITELVATGVLGWPSLVEKMVHNPSRILGLPQGGLRPGADADIVVLDPDAEWVVSKDTLIAKSKNSCFLGRRLKGVVAYTICAGEVAYAQ